MFSLFMNDNHVILHLCHVAVLEVTNVTHKFTIADIIPNIHVVHQTGLECKTGKKRYERYKDGGFLLTQYGTKLLTKNIASKITKVLGQSFSLCSVSETCDNQKKFSEYLTENSDKIYGRRKQHFITKVLKAIMV